MADREFFIFKEEDKDIILTVKTKSPEKWLLIDRETGQIYVGNPEGYWDKMKKIERFDKQYNDC